MSRLTYNALSILLTTEMFSAVLLQNPVTGADHQKAESYGIGCFQISTEVESRIQICQPRVIFCNTYSLSPSEPLSRANKRTPMQPSMRGYYTSVLARSTVPLPTSPTGLVCSPMLPPQSEPEPHQHLSSLICRSRTCSRPSTP